MSRSVNQLTINDDIDVDYDDDDDVDVVGGEVYQPRQLGTQVWRSSALLQVGRDCGPLCAGELVKTTSLICMTTFSSSGGAQGQAEGQTGGASHQEQLRTSQTPRQVRFRGQESQALQQPHQGVRHCSDQV